MGIVISFVVLPLFGQINELIVKLPEYSEQMQGESLLRILKDPSAGVPMLPSNLEGLLNDAINSIMGFLTNVVRNLLNSTVQLVANLVGLIVVPFLAFYFLKDWKVLCNMITDLFTPEARPKASRVMANIGIAISSYVEGLWKLSILSALSVTIVLLILGVPYPLVFGLIALLAETIPVIGPIISAIPAIFVAYTSTTAHTAFVLAIFYIVYYTVDSQVLQPVIMGKKIKLHPVVILLALMIGGKLFGILGMLFAMPVAAVYRVLYDELWHYNGEDIEEDLETDEVAASLTTDPTDDQLVQQRKEMAERNKN
jgi:predicted PurR-regulated permease PerM